LNNTDIKNGSIASNIYFNDISQTDRNDKKALGVSIILYDSTSYKRNIFETLQKEFEQDGKKVLYIKAENMLHKLTSYLEKFFTTEGFHNLFSRYDCLLIDDSHILQNRFATQQEIANLISKLLTVGVSVIIKSSKNLNVIEQVVSKKYFFE